MRNRLPTELAKRKVDAAKFFDPTLTSVGVR